MPAFSPAKSCTLQASQHENLSLLEVSCLVRTHPADVQEGFVVVTVGLGFFYLFCCCLFLFLKTVTVLVLLQGGCTTDGS